MKTMIRRRKNLVIIIRLLLKLVFISCIILIFLYLIQKKIKMENIINNAECCVSFDNTYGPEKLTYCKQNFETNLVPLEKLNVSKEIVKVESIEKTDKKENVEKLSEEYEDSYNDLLYWLSRIINAEAEGASYENKIASGLVVMNRIKDEDYPNTIEEVIFQTKFGIQYASAHNDRIYLEPNEDSIKAAKEILEGTVEVPENVIYQAEFKQGSGVYKKIENEYYCYK